MPETVVTPAQLRWTGGALSTTPLRIDVAAGALRWSGGFIIAGPGTGANLTVTTPKLDRLMRQERIVQSEQPSQRFQTIWQQSMEAIEAAFTALTQQVADNTALLNEIRAAQMLAQAANANAAAVQSTVSLANSYVEPSNVLSASSDGTITITAHTRVYGDTSVSVDGGSVSGFAQGDYVQVYYDDAAREGGAVTYQGTTGLVSQEGARHIVGGVTIPAAGQPPAEGAGPKPPGYVTEGPLP
jgi:archaellum component FlaG (FlaF/FlaG flagellin family)